MASVAKWSQSKMTDEEMREWAVSLVQDHDPLNQNHAYERCELCGFVRHPCDTFDLARAVLALLDRLGVGLGA